MASRSYKFEPATQYDHIFVTSCSRSDYDSALKSCEQLIASSPSNPGLLYWKLRLLHQLGRLEDAREVVKTSASRKRQISDPRILTGMSVVYKAVLTELNPGDIIFLPPPEVVELWEAVLSTGKAPVGFDKQLIYCGVICDWWGLAIRGWTRLRKRYPNNARFFYGYIVYTNLELQECKKHIDILPEGKQKELAISEKLAFTFLKAPLKKTLNREAGTVLVNSARDFRVVMQTFRRSPELALELVSEMTKEDSPLYIFSSILNGDLEFLIDALGIWQEHGRHQEIWDFCTEVKDGRRHIKDVLLTKYRHDASLLDHLLYATVGISTKAAKAEFEELLSGLLNEGTPTREAMHLALKWYSQPNAPQEKLLSICTLLWAKNSTQETCFNDLKLYFESFAAPDRDRFMDFIQSTSIPEPTPQADRKSIQNWLYQRTSCLKFQYLNLALETKWRLCQKVGNALDDIASQALAVARKSLNAGVCGPFALVVLISSLLWKRHSFFLDMSGNGVQPDGKMTRQVLQLLAVNHRLSLSVDYSSEANTISTYLNLLFGLGSLAITNYGPLGVKHLLDNAMSHFLFTRLAVAHPFECRLPFKVDLSSERTWDPVNHLRQTIVSADHGQSRIESYMGENLDHFYPDKMEEMFQLREKLSTDIHYASRLIEYRRLLRLRGLSPTHSRIANLQLARYLNSECYTTDSRDIGTLPNYEMSSLPSFERSIQPASVPEKTWIERMGRIEMISDLLWGSKPVFPIPFHVRNLEKHSYWVRDACANPSVPPRFEQPEELWFSQATGCNEVEKIFHRAWGLLEPFSVILSLPPGTEYPIKPEDLPKVQKQLKTFMDSETKRYSCLSFPTSPLSTALTNIPTQRLFLNHAFYLLEFLQAVVKMTTLASTASKSNSKPPHPIRGAVTVESLSALSKSALQTTKAVQTYAREWSRSLRSVGNGLKCADVKAVLSADGADRVGKQVVELFDDGELVLFVKSTLESAAEALDGVLKVQVKR